VIGVFVRLKLRLIAGNLRGDTMRQIGFVFTLIAAVGVAIGGFTLLSLLRLAEPEQAAAIGVLVFNLIFLSWALGPVLMFGLDDTLDPARLALFPLRTGTLAGGMFAAAATGPWPIAGLIALSGAVAGLATGAGGVVLGLLAVLLLVALCLVTSRLITTALSGVLRSRRGRDLLAIGVVLFIVLAQLPNLVLNRGPLDDPGGLLHSAADVLRWTPPGLAAHAIVDGGWAALGEIALLAVLALVVGRLWILALGRALVRPDASTQRSVRRSRGLVGRVLPDGPLAAVVAKELKYARREPRGWVGWLTSIVVTLVLAFSLSGQDGPSGPALAIAPACLGALLIGLQAGNSFGIDGRSLWMNAVVYGSVADLRRDLAGRHLGLVLIGAPLLLALSLLGAMFAGDVRWAPPAMLTAWGVFGVGLGVGAVTTVVLPYTLPERLNAFSGAAPGQGGIAFAGSMAAMLGTSVLVLPLALPILFGATWLSVLAVPYGALIAWAGRRLAGTIGYPRFPEILAAVSRPT
jgi:ABC-2 type transport system permease protein